MTLDDRRAPAAGAAGQAIAIVGVACRLPDASDIEQLHMNLASGRSSVRNVSRWRRWFSNASLDTDYLMAALDRVDVFDREFFGISEADALSMDPQQRIALELAWSAIEDAAILPSAMTGARTAVFMSGARSSYQSLMKGPATPLSALGTAPGGVSGRISYHLGLGGPSVVVDTGCSASLVAVGLAVDALRLRRCDYALAGGVSLQATIPTADEVASYDEIMASDGICRAFDADASGTADGEGGAVLVLRRLHDAQRDGDHIRAVIRSVCVNHNSDTSNGITAPSVDAQLCLLRESWREAGVEPGQIAFVEAHGSGTRLGDAIELSALAAAIGAGRLPCYVSSLKSNMGHLDHAAGIASLVKVVSALEHRSVYPTVNFRRLNPEAVIEGSSVTVSTNLSQLPDGQCFAGLSSFGITGTNAHAVLATAPPRRAVERDPARPGALVVTLSARTPDVLAEYCHLIAERLEQDPGLDVADAAFVLNACRTALAVRTGWLVNDRAELLDAARAAAERRAGPPRITTPARTVAVLPDDVDAGGGELAARLRAHLRSRGITVAGDATNQELAYRLAADAGLEVSVSLATGRGVRVQNIVRPDEAAGGEAHATGAVDRGALARALDALSDQPSIFVVFGAPGSELAEALAELSAGPVHHCFDGGQDGQIALGRLLLGCYLDGGSVDWQAYHRGMPVRRIPMPRYPFSKTRSWPLEPGEPVPIVQGNAPVAQNRSAEHFEAVLNTLLAKVLQTSELGDDPDYFALGGNSVRGLDLITHIQRQTGITVSLVDLYSHPRVRDLADHLAELSSSDAGHAGAGQAIEARRAQRYPLSYGQESLWFMQRIDPSSTVYNVTTDLRLRGPLDIQALRRALGRLTTRHEALRSRYVEEGSTVVAVTSAPSLPELPVVVVPPGTDEERSAAAGRLVKEAALAPYDLERGPLFRAALFEFDEHDHVLVCGTHHSVDDGWSPAIIDRELSAFYQAELSGVAPGLPPLPIQYSDFAAWQRETMGGARMDAELDFWLSYLDGGEPLELRGDRPRPARLSDHGAHHYFTVDGERTARMRQISTAERCTLFTTTLALFAAQLHLESRGGDFLVGTIVAGRDRPETRDLIGYFNNMVALRIDAADSPSFRTLLRRVRSSFLATVEHHAVPFAKVVEALRPKRDLSRHPVFQIGFTYQNMPRMTERLGGLAKRRSQDRQYLFGLAPDRAPWDLNLTLWETDGEASLIAVYEYATDLFDEATLARMSGQYLMLLDRALAQPDRPLADLDLLSEAEYAQAERLSVTTLPRLAEPGSAETDVLTVIHEIATSDPARPAIIDKASNPLPGGTVATYGELEEQVKAVAAGLFARGVKPGDTIAVILPRGGDLVLTALAAWWIGAAYAPIDPATSTAHVATLLDSAGIKLVVTQAAGLPLGTASADQRTVAELGRTRVPVNRTPYAPCVPAYVMFTSGTTGEPKPVLLTHGALSPFIRTWRSLSERQGAPWRLMSLAAPAFDVFTGDALRALATGGTLILPPIEAIADAGELIRIIRENGVNAFEVVPAHLRAEIVNRLTADGEILDPIRILAVGLESWREAELAATLAVLPGEAVVVNLFGITECGIDSCARIFSAGDMAGREANGELVPIGHPYPGVSAYVLNEALRPVACGAIGELFIGGAGLALGYLGRPALTADRFVPDAFATAPGARLYRSGDLVRRRADGALEFLGRADEQVKLHGYRIDLTEIESVLRDHPSVQSAVVRIRGAARDARLTAYLVGRDPALRPMIDELRGYLRGRLAEYMVPRRIRWLDTIPLTGNGKVDTRALDALAEPAPTSQGAVRPRDSVEMVIVGHFRALLGVDSVSVRDDFFDLGGHSLLAVRLAAEVRKSFDARLPLSTLFENPTPESLARILRSEVSAGPPGYVLRLSDGPGVPLVLAPPSGGASLCYYQMARAVTPGRTIFGLQAPGASGETEPLASIELIAADFAERLVAYGVAGPVAVGGWSMGGTVAHQLAHELEKRGIEVPLEVMIDSEPVLSDPQPLPAQDHRLLRYLLVLNYDFEIPEEELSGLSERSAFLRTLQAAQDEGHFSPYMTPESVQHLLLVLRRNEDALAAYRPSRAERDAIVLRTADGPAPLTNQAADLGWAAYTRNVRVRQVAGSHFSLVPTEYRALAKALSEELGASGL